MLRSTAVPFIALCVNDIVDVVVKFFILCFVLSQSAYCYANDIVENKAVVYDDVLICCHLESLEREILVVGYTRIKLAFLDPI